ncbi:MAG TPA: multicopper oxidase family protein [Stellaceae bacterium]|nr:multicopper oxidase family protein [Stellaceae bacterium]
MTGERISRRRLLQATLGLIAGEAAYRVAGRSALAAKTTSLVATTRTIEVNGKAAKAYALLNASGTIGLNFTVGDAFKVRLDNKLSEPTLVHWHGLTPPSAQDGVPDLSQAPIPAGASYDYDFPLKTPGTYWMHSHFGLTQTQRLLSAPLIIRTPDDLKRDEQEVVVRLNDFTFRDPEEILAQLRSKSALEDAKPSTQASSTDAMKMGQGAMNMGSAPKPGGGSAATGTPQSSGMSGMAMGADVNDIDFDAYLANDRTLADPEVFRVEGGGRVRLRIINMADSTNFIIDLGALSGEVVAVDGGLTVPIRGSKFPIAMAQRLDIRLNLPAGGGAFPILALREGDTARTGFVLASNRAKIARIAESGSAKAGLVGLDLEQKLVGVEPLSPRKADRTSDVPLGGDMQKYVWTMNGEVYGKNKPIPVKAGERVELAIKNETMMSHPMHLHGTVFQVVAINGRRFQGARRDTVMVPPMASVTIAFDADNPGRWAFHCHNGYHMEAGMFASVDYV